MKFFSSWTSHPNLRTYFLVTSKGLIRSSSHWLCFRFGSLLLALLSVTIHLPRPNLFFQVRGRLRLSLSCFAPLFYSSLRFYLIFLLSLSLFCINIQLVTKLSTPNIWYVSWKIGQLMQLNYFSCIYIYISIILYNFHLL